MKRILVIDDDREMCMLLNRFLTRNGFEVVEVYSGKAALAYISQNGADAALCDYRLEDMDGRQVLAGIKAIRPNIPVIIITGYSDVKAAVEVTKMGAYDYVTKPLLPDEILLTIKKSLDKSSPKTDSAGDGSNKKTTDTTTEIKLANNDYIFGNSPVFNNIITQVKRVAPTNFSVILYGESGCGKEVIAQTIHKNSKRANAPFIAIDCGALGKELSGSELFGHEKGAFTGAINQKVGSLELANGGTIFLDEIVNLSYDIQVSLLRVVQERKIRRVGGVKDIEIDVRIIVASNEKLMDAAKKGKFREDLFHRFNEFSIDVPPLRERGNDILLFAKHFLKSTSQELEKNVTSLSPKVEEVFLKYSWPGNLRELKNIIKRSALLTDTDTIDINVLPFEMVNYSKLQFDEHVYKEPTQQMYVPDESRKEDAHSAFNFNTPSHTSAPASNGHFPEKILVNEKSLKAAGLNAEYNMIVEALKQANYNKSKAARILNIDRKTLYNKMEEYKLLSFE
ncbi:sigma-54-dependent transcriptional regulator [Parasediminibacterium sp. JCM 36343]|uniref:sigma-54-dependent transcriptional regulator n=1 Tax=Parasediminibacterium sp. JCM 36343 TaxID=3374279 RepID=UPI00397E3F39